MPSDTEPVRGVELPSRRIDDLPTLQSEDGELLRGRDSGVDADPGSEPSDTSCLAESVVLRMPVFTAEMSGRQRAELLQDHILETAHMRGRLAELRLNAQINLRAATSEWVGTATLRRSSRSAKATEEMKREENPELARRIDGAKWLIARCTEEMDRLGGNDYEAASRAYTILSGG
ncbi:MAG: hypothetical protein NVS3B1_22090 [Marmoricola sp.]